MTDPYGRNIYGFGASFLEILDLPLKGLFFCEIAEENIAFSAICSPECVGPDHSVNFPTVVVNDGHR